MKSFLRQGSCTIPNFPSTKKLEKGKQDLEKEKVKMRFLFSILVWQDTVLLSCWLFQFSIFFLDFELPILPKGDIYPSVELYDNSSFTPATLPRETLHFYFGNTDLPLLGTGVFGHVKAYKHQSTLGAALYAFLLLSTKS